VGDCSPQGKGWFIQKGEEKRGGQSFSAEGSSWEQWAELKEIRELGRKRMGGEH